MTGTETPIWDIFSSNSGCAAMLSTSWKLSLSPEPAKHVSFLMKVTGLHKPKAKHVCSCIVKAQAKDPSSAEFLSVNQWDNSHA